MEQIFRKSLQSILEKKITGEIKIYIKGNRLEVLLIAPHNIRFGYVLDDIQFRLCYGLTSEFLAREIIFEYKKFIKKLFFL